MSVIIFSVMDVARYFASKFTLNSSSECVLANPMQCAELDCRSGLLTLWVRVSQRGQADDIWMHRCL